MGNRFQGKGNKVVLVNHKGVAFEGVGHNSGGKHGKRQKERLCNGAEHKIRQSPGKCSGKTGLLGKGVRGFRHKTGKLVPMTKKKGNTTKEPRRRTKTPKDASGPCIKLGGSGTNTPPKARKRCGGGEKS